MVWAGGWSGGRVGPFFFDGSVSTETYLNLLNEKVWPKISRSVKREKLWYQKDGSPHTLPGLYAIGLIAISQIGGLEDCLNFLGLQDPRT